MPGTGAVASCPACPRHSHGIRCHTPAPKQKPDIQQVFCSLGSLMEGERVWGDTPQKGPSKASTFPFQLHDQSALFSLLNYHCSGRCRVRGPFLLHLPLWPPGSNPEHPEKQAVSILPHYCFPLRNISYLALPHWEKKPILMILSQRN